MDPVIKNDTISVRQAEGLYIRRKVSSIQTTQGALLWDVISGIKINMKKAGQVTTTSRAKGLENMSYKQGLKKEISRLVGSTEKKDFFSIQVQKAT